MKPSQHIKISGIDSGSFGMIFSVALLFILFAAQNGWYRVDCALGVQEACNLIKAEKAYSVNQKGE